MYPGVFIDICYFDFILKVLADDYVTNFYLETRFFQRKQFKKNWAAWMGFYYGLLVGSLRYSFCIQIFCLLCLQFWMPCLGDVWS